MHSDVRERHAARFRELLPGLRARIDWPTDRLREERSRALRALLSKLQRFVPL